MEYIIFIFTELTLVLLKKLKKYNTIIFKIMMFTAFILTIIRFDVSQDYQSYYKVGLGYQLWDYNRFEEASKLFYQISWFLEMPQMYFILSSLITYYFLYKGIKNNSDDELLSAYIFICFFFLNSFSTVRQSMAEAYLLYISQFLFKNNKRYILYLLVGIIFHKTILIAFIYMFLVRVKINRINLMILNFSYLYREVIFSILEKIPIKILHEKIFEIRNYLLLDAGGNKWIFIYIIINIFLILLKKKKAEKQEEVYLNIVVLGSFFYGILGGLLGFRVGTYFFIMYILLIPIYYKRSIKWIKIIIINFMTIIFLMQIFLGKNNLIPYKYIYMQPENIQFRDDKNNVFYLKKEEIERIKWRLK